jgi:hypothetical protein
LMRLSTNWGCISTSFMPCGFSPYLTMIMEHCSYRGRKSNFSSLPLILKRISPTPTSICAPAVLRKGRPIRDENETEENETEIFRIDRFRFLYYEPFFNIKNC